MSLLTHGSKPFAVENIDFAKRLSQLFARTTSGHYIPAIDGMRCLAIVAVIMHHLGGYVLHRTPHLDKLHAQTSLAYMVTSVTNSGVQLFFVISGFVLAIPFATHSLRRGKPVALGPYFFRRMWRLHIPYLLNMAAMAGLLIVLKRQPWSDVGPHFLASSFYVHNLVYQSMSTVNGVAWSLEIEIQFVLLAPLLALLYRIPNQLPRRLVFCLAIVAITLLRWRAGNSVSYPLSGCVLYYVDYFLCGMLLADIQVSSLVEAGNYWQGVCWDIAGICAFVGCFIAARNATLAPFLTAVIFVLCASGLRGTRLNHLFSQRWLVLVGGMCYTIYLYHFLVISFVGSFVAPFTDGFSYSAALALQSSLILPSIVIACAFLFVVTEKPFMAPGRPQKTATV